MYPWKTCRVLINESILCIFLCLCVHIVNTNSVMSSLSVFVFALLFVSLSKCTCRGLTDAWQIHRFEWDICGWKVNSGHVYEKRSWLYSCESVSCPRGSELWFQSFEQKGWLDMRSRQSYVSVAWLALCEYGVNVFCGGWSSPRSSICCFQMTVFSSCCRGCTLELKGKDWRQEGGDLKTRI